MAQQRCNATIAIATILASQSHNALGQHCFLVVDQSLIALGRPRLLQDPTGSTFRDTELLLNLCHQLATPGGDYYFFASASSRIDLSRDRSATSLFRRAFSRSNSFSLRT